SVRKGVRVGFLGQNPVFNEEANVQETLFAMETPMMEVVREYEALLADPNHDGDKLQNAMIKMDELQAWDYEARIQQVLSKLGITFFEQKVKHLSGGQRKRVAMARVLIEDPDLLILDEPTNHLDLDTIEWLENFLATNNGTLLMVTHDRYFLDRVTNEIWELERAELYQYKGNYAYFLEKKAERQYNQVMEKDKAQNLMKKELEWMRRQPQARGTKSRSRIDAFYELQDKANVDLSTQQLQLDVKTSRQGNKILEVEKISKAFGPKKLVNNFSYVFKKKDRIGIIGKNGTGKTTFLEMLTGQQQPDSGEIASGQTTVFGYYRQEELDFKPDNRVIDIVKDVAEVIETGNGEFITAAKLLEHFQFPSAMQYTMVGKLSGGEKRRLQLLKVLMKNPNFLILDEPTNDLDLITLSILEDFLDSFGGCLLIVSHDRYF
ncbi:MAG: ABC-F family ATP-binding cassette domain-containing protein, partial [Sphingobacteriales bacterium]